MEQIGQLFTSTTIPDPIPCLLVGNNEDVDQSSEDTEIPNPKSHVVEHYVECRQATFVFGLYHEQHDVRYQEVRYHCEDQNKHAHDDHYFPNSISLSDDVETDC